MFHRQGRRLGLRDTAFNRNALAGSAAYTNQSALHISSQFERRREVVRPRRRKSLQGFHIPHEQVIAVVVAGDEDTVPRTINRDFAIIMLKFVKFLRALAGGVVGIYGRKSSVILLKIECYRVCALRHCHCRGASRHHSERQQGCNSHG